MNSEIENNTEKTSEFQLIKYLKNEIQWVSGLSVGQLFVYPTWYMQLEIGLALDI